MSLIDTRPVAATTKLAVPCASLTYGIVDVGSALQVRHWATMVNLNPKVGKWQLALISLCAIFRKLNQPKRLRYKIVRRNLGGLIEQPALQVAQEQRQEEDESLAPAAAKKLCSDASGNSAQLHCQDIDFANSNFFSGQVGFS